MNKKLVLISTAIVASLAVNAPVHAAATNDSSLFTVVENFEGFDGLVTQGPLVLGGGVQVTSSIDSTFGAVAVDLGENGTWGAGNNFAGLGDLSLTPSSYDYNGSLTFNWSAATNGVGALFSIYQAPNGVAEILLEALSFSGSVLESSTLVINFADNSLYNAGTFAGFIRGSADVYGLRVSGDGVVLDNLSLAPVVPIPAALPLLLSGLGMLGAALRRRKNG